MLALSARRNSNVDFWLDHFGLITGLLESKIVGESRHEAMPGRCSWMIRTLAAAAIVVLGEYFQ
jgi:hypothetical protein